MCAMCVRAFACMFTYLSCILYTGSYFRTYTLYTRFRNKIFAFCDDIQIALTLLSLLIFKAGKRESFSYLGTTLARWTRLTGRSRITRRASWACCSRSSILPWGSLRVQNTILAQMHYQSTKKLSIHRNFLSTCVLNLML